MPASGQPVVQRIAILGGGIAALTAAYELARRNVAGQPKRFEITVYQQGWRLGGKGASGRNAKCGGRIEEHGLHIWFGAYENAFRLMNEVYGHDVEKWPKGDFPTAFSPQYGFHLAEGPEGGWRPWHFPLPARESSPGDANEQGKCTPKGVLHRLGFWLAGYSETSAFRQLSLSTGKLGQLATAADGDHPGSLNPGNLRGLAERLRVLAQTEDVAERQALVEAYRATSKLANRARMLLEHPVSMAYVAGLTWEDVRRAAEVVAIAAAVLWATLRSEAYTADDWDKLNEKDLREWLRDDAGLGELADSALIAGSYDLFFSYLDGDESKPAIEAGSALRAAIWLLFEYKGAFMWRMNTGMGDAIFVPLHNVLRSLGVTFRFFHKVTALKVARDGSDLIEAIEIQPQAAMKAGYRLFVNDADGHECWPHVPDFAHLDRGDELESNWDANNLESDWSKWAPPGFLLRKGVDFDHVVLGIPIGALGGICKELKHKPRFAKMLSEVQTVQTQALQLWLKKPLEDLEDPAARYCEPPVLTTFLNPIDTYADMTHLLKCERWPADDQPAHVAYFCGVLQELPHAGGKTDPGYPGACRSRIKDYAFKMLKPQSPPGGGTTLDPAAMRALWKGAYTADNGQSFDWGLLCGSKAAGEARMDDQYLRANIDGSERYVIAAPGTSRLRLEAGKSGFPNLTLTGDWIYNGLFLGCVEGAVISGKLAARAVSGERIRIFGEGNIFKPL